MRPIRLQKDNVVRAKRDRTGVGWPVCAKCMQPVHGYGIEAERKRGDGVREIDVYGECCHQPASGCRCSPRDRDHKILTVPKTQTREQFVKSIGLLVFFTPSGAA